jgi:hypothetical protein
VVRSEGFAKKIAATIIALYRGNKAGTISLFWNDNYSENDDNIICSNTNTNDDQQNTTRQDDNKIRISKRHKNPPVTTNGDIMVKKLLYKEYIS